MAGNTEGGPTPEEMGLSPDQTEGGGSQDNKSEVSDEKKKQTQEDESNKKDIVERLINKIEKL